MIFTIGYSNRSLPEFLSELSRRRIGQIWDVRSSPWSRNTPFYAPQIEQWSERAGIHYRRAGDILGGRSDIALDDPQYVAMLDLMIAAAGREPLVIMCAEGDPAQCHRTYDIGASLLVRHGIIARSILRDGRDEDIIETLARINPNSLRGELGPALSRQIELF